MGKVNIDAKEALAELGSLVVKMKELRAQINAIKNNSKGSYDDMSDSMKKLNANSAALSARIKYLQNIIDKQYQSQRKATAETKKATRTTKKHKKAIDDASKATDKNVKANKKLSVSLKNLLQGFGLIAGVQFLKDIALQTFEQIKTFDSLRYTLRLLNDTVQEYNSANRFLTALTRDFGVELISTTNRWVKFSTAAKNAGLSVRETENIFRSMTKAGASLGLKTDELTGIYLALEQMLSKGKVTTEELRRQLGERLPGAMGIMAGAIGVTLPKLDEMLRKGEVLSADVLPKFADAVEVAYGIESVKKVDTLVSAQNRLVTSWQEFVKSVSGSESVINNTLTFLINKTARLASMLTSIFGGEDFRMQEAIMEQEREVMRTLNLFARNRYGIAENYAKSDLGLKKVIADIEAKLDIEGDPDKRAELQTELDEARRMMVEFNKEIKRLQVEIARELFAATIEPYQEAKKKYNEIIADFNSVKEGDKVKSLFDQDDLDEARSNLINATAQYSTYLKFMEESNVETGDDEEDKNKVRVRTTTLKKIADLEKKFQIAVLQRNIETNKSLIESDETTFDEKINLIDENNKKANLIAETQAEIEKEAAIRYEEEKIAAIEKARARGDIFEGVEPDQQIEDLAEERADKILIAEENMLKKMVANNREANNEILKVTQESGEQYVMYVKDKYNKEIIAANEAYENSKKTEKDKEALALALKKIGIEAANAQIDAQIRLRRALLANADLSQDAIAKIILEINELEASKQKFLETNSESVKSDQEMFEELMHIVSEYSRAIGGIVDGLHARKIENINAEIEAEERKYDKLIQLAENDAEQEKTLRRNKEEAIQVLEKKRLKEEQKQAKSRKAFAIAEIAINTAVAISKVLSQTGLFGIPMVPLVAALGAAQIAAVIAQPIPKFKDGGTSDKDQIAMINDGGKQEYIKRGDDILTATNKDAIVGLRKNDVVYKDYDDMINKELLAPNNISSIGLNEGKFNELFFGIRSSIDEGFKKAKINNVVNVINKNNNDDYRQRLSRW